MVRKYTILHGIFEEKYIIDILKKEIVKTRDGSNTIFVPEFDETYHSTHGAIQESLHVFIQLPIPGFLDYIKILYMKVLAFFKHWMIFRC